MSSIIQSIESAREERVGREGVAPATLNAMLERAEGGLKWLRERHADKGLALLQLPAQTSDLASIKKAADKLRDGATDVVLLGTGGSSLGGQTLAQLADHAVAGAGSLRSGPQLHFMDNLDPITFGSLLDRLPLKTSRFVAISKSGGTGETLMQTIAVLTALEKAGLGDTISKVMVGLTEPNKPGNRNGLRDLLSKYDVEILDHDTGVGGRFSALTNVGLIPAAVLGLDIAAIRQGAGQALAPVLAGKSAKDVSSALGASLAVALAESRGKTVSVVMPYTDRLERMTRWYVQLWAESLGKDGKGTTPLGCNGPVDQHSQLQLFIGGPRDKLFTVITTSPAGRGPVMDAKLSALAGEPDFAGKTIGDLVAAQGRATAETLAKNGCPVRTIHIPTLDEKSLGELLMHYMLETIIAAHLIGVDAFDQPAVEEGKILAKQYLNGK
ncbi:glucose-6-phosphate isomerase [Variibacter gotjawalensis]|uniref:Glucose-6-phosphate isomerase n=1 Tax=Variibacter gotjawalensis TaxID=1333996 RepID=A0A0S3PQT0_9BRAD|nr:glucose-6-phosphate isomerase [Variibacter gotjawalensis]NIK48595.1 glucose-6-phosphate isomerase [Variibacter gotjawalensis]RZS50460.1 glucose-6-phosphate isomerase [Variibacter gotjawalensis]BAT58294.1 glucose-6-phosphate isomerase [Variibacter gotjawalensis]